MAKLNTVKCYFSELNEEKIRLVMYRNGRSKKYGIVTVRENTVIAPDYKGGGEELRTFLGNEEQVIDWTTVEIANTRYRDLLAKLIGQVVMPTIAGKGNLRLVHG